MQVNIKNEVNVGKTNISPIQDDWKMAQLFKCLVYIIKPFKLMLLTLIFERQFPLI